MTAARAAVGPLKSELRARDAGTALDHALFGLLPLLMTGCFAYYIFKGGDAALDFRQQYWVVGWRVLHGTNLYHWTYRQMAAGISFPYPALAAIVFVPFSLIPLGVSAAVFTIICVLAAWGTLRVLQVRDWRIYGVILMWGPIIAAWQTANLTLLLGLGIALVWRYRDRPAVAGLLTALLLSLKSLVWPLALWLLVTRRYRAFAQMILGGLVINIVAWAVVGPGQIPGFLSHSTYVIATHYWDGYGVPAFLSHLGFGRTLGEAVEVVVALAVAGACFANGRRGDDRRALTLGVALMLVASPLVWNHYLALMIVPLAISRPRIGWAWILPMILLVCPADSVGLWQIVLLWLVTAACLTDTLRHSVRSATIRSGPETAIPVSVSS